METIKVSIVEDNLDFQRWITEEINDAPNITCISKHTSGLDAVQKIPSLSPDIVLMDLTLKKPGIDGIECIFKLKCKSPELSFLVITSHNDEQRLFEALKVGAGAYIHKEDIPGKLSDLINEFYKGGSPMSPGIARMVIQQHQGDVEDLKRLSKLTKREMDILKQLASGYLNKEIANNLGIVEGTVKVHINKIYKKLEVDNRTEAAKKYLNK